MICEHGSRSPSLAALLGQKAFAKVYNVLGGTAGWREANLPIERPDSAKRAA